MDPGPQRDDPNQLDVLPGWVAVGIWAPLGLLVLRMVQGFSASGEYAGAATFLSEYTPRGRRGLYTSLVPASTATGLLAGSLLVAMLHQSLRDASLEAWRYTGFALSFNTANALLGGTAPFVATWLIAVTGSNAAPAWYLTVGTRSGTDGRVSGSLVLGAQPS